MYKFPPKYSHLNNHCKRQLNAFNKLVVFPITVDNLKEVLSNSDVHWFGCRGDLEANMEETVKMFNKYVNHTPASKFPNLPITTKVSSNPNTFTVRNLSLLQETMERNLNKRNDDAVDALMYGMYMSMRGTATARIKHPNITNDFFVHRSDNNFFKGNFNMNNEKQISITASTDAFAETTVTTIYGNDITKLNKESLYNMLHRIRKDIKELDTLEIGKSKYAKKTLLNLNAAQEAIIAELDKLVE